MSRVVSVVALSLVLTACGSQDPPAAPPVTGTTTTTSPATTEHARPTSVADLAKDPCAALSKDAAAAVGAVAGGNEPDPTDPAQCSWVVPPAVVLVKAFGARDVVPEYAAKPGAVPLTVGGRPATQIVVGQSCFTHVTAGPDQSFRVGANGDGDSCALTVEVATAVLANLG